MYKKILVPVSLDIEGDGAAAVAAAEKLKADGASVTLIHVMEPPHNFAAVHLPPDLVEQNKKMVSDAFEALAAQISGPSKAQVVVGHPARAILDAVESEGADCVVIRSHKPGIEDYFLGSTASHVVRHAPCSVHVIR